MQSALLSVKGVARARVRFEGSEAMVEYDPALCKVEDLIAAVGKVEAPLMGTRFAAVVKNPDD